MNKLILAGIATCSISFFSCSENPADKAAIIPKKDLTPVEAVKQVQADAVSGKVSSLWDSMPASYQSDVEGLVHEFADKADADVYYETIKTLKSINKLFKNNHALVFEVIKEKRPNLKEGEVDKIKPFKENIAVFTDLFDTFLSTNIKNTESLKQLSITQMTDTIEPECIKVMEIFQTAFPDKNKEILAFKNATLELVSEDKDNAAVKVKIGDKPETEKKLTRVEDRWILSEMATQWESKMEKAKENLAKINELKPAQKLQVIAAMKMIQGAASTLEAAETKEEMIDAIDAQKLQFSALMMGLFMMMPR